MNTFRYLVGSVLALQVAVLFIGLSLTTAALSSELDEPTPLAGEDNWDVPELDTSGMEPRVAQLLRHARQQVVQAPRSADRWWRFAAACDVHMLRKLAIPAYRRAWALAPAEFRIIYNLAVAVDSQGADSDEAIDLLRQAEELRRDYVPLHVRLGDALAKRGRLTGARDTYVKALELNPDLGAAHRGLGQVLLALNADGALFHLERAAAMEPTDGPTAAALARAYARLGKKQRALEAAQRFRDRPDALRCPDPVRAEVVRMGVSSVLCGQRAMRALRRKDYGLAVRNLLIATKADPSNARSHYLLGHAALMAGRLDLAERHLSEAVRLNDDFGPAHVKLGQVFLSSRGPDPAIREFRRALEISPENAPAHCNLGIALEHLGRVDEAGIHYRRAVEIDPNSVAKERLARLGSNGRH